MKKITQISRERALIAFHNIFDMLLFVIFLVFYNHRRVEDSSRKGGFWGGESLKEGFKRHGWLSWVVYC